MFTNIIIDLETNQTIYEFPKIMKHKISKNKTSIFSLQEVNKDNAIYANDTNEILVDSSGKVLETHSYTPKLFLKYANILFN